jgi:hypothetical protein
MTSIELGPETLWRCYQRGYSSLVNSGAFFRQLLRPVISHAFFQRALPLLQEYARSNSADKDPSPGFRDRLEASMLSPRDLIHLDYAICLGYLDIVAAESGLPGGSFVMQWPGPASVGGTFVASDPIQKSKPPRLTAMDEADVWQMLTTLGGVMKRDMGGPRPFNDLPGRSALLNRLFGLNTDIEEDAGRLSPDEEAELDLDLALAELEEAAGDDDDDLDDASDLSEPDGKTDFND